MKGLGVEEVKFTWLCMNLKATELYTRMGKKGASCNMNLPQLKMKQVGQARDRCMFYTKGRDSGLFLCGHLICLPQRTQWLQ